MGDCKPQAWRVEMMVSWNRRLVGGAAGALAWAMTGLAVAADAPVEVSEAWVRATGAGQPVGAAYASITARAAVRLTGVRAPVAKTVEVHEMKHEGGVMKMRSLKEIRLAAGETVKLEPGGLHMMFFGLKGPLEAGGSVPLTFEFRGADGKRFTQMVEAPIRAPQAPAGAHTGHDRH
jgi:copper(I)-binding protein